MVQGNFEFVRDCVCLGSEKHIIFQVSVYALTLLHVFKSFSSVFSFSCFCNSVPPWNTNFTALTCLIILKFGIHVC